jgi:ribosomal protein S18 acetylase RimI-like enzyme
MIELEQKCPTAAHWTQRQYHVALRTDDSGGSQRLVLVVDRNSETGRVSEARETPELLAFLVAHHLGPEWELENLVVAPTARRKGLGARLVGVLLSHAREAGSGHVFLEVRESNQAARILYEKSGFEETGRRSGYYLDPLEDAILYRQRLP